jgi:hypothetical protein
VEGHPLSLIKLSKILMKIFVLTDFEPSMNFSDDEVQDVVMTWLRERVGDFYDAGVNKLLPRLTKCIAIRGDYVEK